MDFKFRIDWNIYCIEISIFGWKKRVSDQAGVDGVEIIPEVFEAHLWFIEYTILIHVNLSAKIYFVNLFNCKGKWFIWKILCVSNSWKMIGWEHLSPIFRIKYFSRTAHSRNNNRNSTRSDASVVASHSLNRFCAYVSVICISQCAFWEFISCGSSHYAQRKGQMLWNNLFNDYGKHFTIWKENLWLKIGNRFIESWENCLARASISSIGKWFQAGTKKLSWKLNLVSDYWIWLQMNWEAEQQRK